MWVWVFCVGMEASGFLFGMRVRLSNLLMLEKPIFLESTSREHRGQTLKGGRGQATPRDAARRRKRPRDAKRRREKAKKRIKP